MTKRYIHSIWFMRLTDDSDYMGILCRDDDGPWKIEYRFRYYSPDSTNPHDGKDEKSWYTANMKNRSNEALVAALKAQKEVICAMEKKSGYKCDCVVLECFDNDPKMLFELGSRTWAHMKIV
jgi:hypothetical protein